MALGDSDATARLRRQLAETAIAQATRGEWDAAVDTNRELVDLGPDVDGFNRLGKALAELGRNDEALAAYEQALERDGTNRIAQRNVERLRMVTASSGAARGGGRGKPGKGAKGGKAPSEKAPSTVFIEEMGKTGRARLINLATPRALAPLSPGDALELVVDGDALIATSREGVPMGTVEPRIAARLLKLTAAGNRYEAAVTTVHEAGEDVTMIIREVFTHPANFGKVSFPTLGGSAGGVRPYMKGTALRYDDDDEEVEADEDAEEVEELDTTLPEYSGEPELEEELVEEP
ncbi:MAG: tetratricopeptide repeat protein [Candidatus Limnocylindria bacterium]